MNSEPMRSRWVSFTFVGPAVDHMPAVGASRAPRLPRRSQAIPESANRLDQIAGGSELRPESLHVHVHRARLDVGGRFPYGLEQVAARLDSPASLGERDEQTILGRRKLDIVTVDCNTVCSSIDLERASSQNVHGRLRSLRNPPKDRADTKHELLRAERLRQVVVGA